MTTVQRSKESSIVLYPSPGMGHLVSMVELAKLFLTFNLRVTILVLDPPNDTGSTAPFIDRVSASHPSMAFHRLPSMPLSSNYLHHESLHFELIRLSTQNVLSFLSSAAFETPPSALVFDVFCISALDVASELRIPSYLFYTSPASCLAFFLHFPTIHDTMTESFRDLGSTPIDFPGSLPIPADHMGLPLQDRHDESYMRFLEGSRRLTEPAGILVNTYEWLEPRALRAIRDRANVPPVLAIGPLIRSASDDPDHPCLQWLDSQPSGSVVFLCFGSLGRFSAEQLNEIATGLERSGQRFLWAVRSPPNNDPKQPSVVAEPEEFLPRGFVERTRARGLVVGPWAPQRAVLRHEAVGGFVTHLGWNSVLEALWEGVPMVGWPLYAEQRMNRVLMVEDLGMAVGVEGYVEGLVRAEEVERKVRELMEGEAGRGVRERVREARERASEALGEGGTSRRALEEVVRAWKGED